MHVPIFTQFPDQGCPKLFYLDGPRSDRARPRSDQTEALTGLKGPTRPTVA